MDFPQQIEETLVERPPIAYDVVMESPLTMDCRALSLKTDTGRNLSSGNLCDKMNSSMNSTMDDTTPSDSGVQMLDSEASELMIESITSQSGFEFDEIKSAAIGLEKIVATNSTVDTNSNVTTNTTATTDAKRNAIHDAMTASACSTFDTTENIVYRRKVRKPTANSGNKAPKKRVSFHEDILKNTRTDNIHIEHGFITYKNGRKLPTNVSAGRYSWSCSEGQAAGSSVDGRHAELCGGDEENAAAFEAGSDRRRVVYRNACSDVLDYGNSDVYDTNETYDNSGVFEYLPRQTNDAAESNPAADTTALDRCSCSSSNSSLDSEEHDKNSNRRQEQKSKTYGSGQCKSSSCDCVSNANNNFIGESCYFSEPNIDNLNDVAVFKKSVWNKEKKPKSSCLKKTKYHANFIQEQDLSSKMKKFNVHDVNQLLDNSSKMLFGSLKSIFTIPVTERGVPEGSEDLQPVVECLSELEQTPEHKFNQFADTHSPTSPVLKAKPFLSKSLDGTKAQQSAKKFVHNVDEQLRRKNNPEDAYTPAIIDDKEKTPQPRLQRQHEFEIEQQCSSYPLTSARTKTSTLSPPPQSVQFRNKFIVNCESTVFEHTGVSYEAQQPLSFSGAAYLQAEVEEEGALVIDSPIDKRTSTPIAQAEPTQIRSAFYNAPIAKTFSNFFRSFKEATSNTTDIQKKQKETSRSLNVKSIAREEDIKRSVALITTNPSLYNQNPIKPLQNSTLPTTTMSSSMISSELSSSSTGSISKQGQIENISSNSLVLAPDIRLSVEKQTRHLASPLKKRGSSGSNLTTAMQQPQRYGTSSELTPISPDDYNRLRCGNGRDSKSTILSEEFDDILTITTDTDDKNESDIVIVDYPSELNYNLSGRNTSTVMEYGNLLKPSATASSKTSLINRFLRNVTQKKILEETTSMRRNTFFASKLKSEQKILTGQLYVRGVRGPQNYELIDDLNAEIAMEIEMSGAANSPRRELTSINSTDIPGDVSRFDLGIGEISIDIFNGNYLHILRDSTEQLMKVFKLYTGYSCEGYMTPVLVFLTERTLYVTDLVRNRLCTKFALAYVDLDVILLGPAGNTVLLSNSARDMQQVLLAGGPYPADGLVANLELCARRGGSTLPAVGQLTLEHLAPLRAFVRENSCVGRNDQWMYYAVVNIPACSLGNGINFCGTIGGGGGGGGVEKEPLGPHVKGFLMHRRVRDQSSHYNSAIKHYWNPGYFLLKAGVLYMFNDSMQKLPSWAMALAECQGARRAVNAGRPHCFEIMLRGGELLQMAAPDEYVASEWLQALLQSASGLFEMQEKHKTLGCTLVITQNHLITLREDFTAPLRKTNKNTTPNLCTLTDARQKIASMLPSLSADPGSVLGSTKSTPTKAGTLQSNSSLNSTPTKLSQISRSTTTSNTLTSPTASTSRSNLSDINNIHRTGADESYTNMSSVYGKNSGLEILTCADIKEMTGIKIPSHNDTWWCILEFSCQEVRESSDDLALFFASSAEMQRFLRLLEQLWQAKNNDLFPITVLDEEDLIAEQCTMLYMDINRSWEPLLSAALGYPL